jgi:radical SAM superfamily enzyme YgiQ (UPF0313 family)
MGLSPRGLDREFLELMWRAGFTSFMMSPDSASDTVLSAYRKGLSKDDLVHAAEAIQPTRFTVLWFFLLGGPGETNATIAETLDFTTRHLCRGIRPPYHMANFYLGVRLYPGTDLWDLARSQGYVGEGSDPLEQTWYLSHDLDLNRALEQLYQAAADHPEVNLGSAERFLPFSKYLTFFANLLRVPKPYWRHTWALNRLVLKVRRRFLLPAEQVASGMQEKLRRQGYRGPLLEQGRGAQK